MKRTASLILAGLLSAAPAAAQEDTFDSEPLIVTPEQKEAVERGLAWLASQQNPDGSWSAKIGYNLNNDYP